MATWYDPQCDPALHEARELLDRLRELLQQDRWKNDADSQAFMREAERLMNPDGRM